MSRIAYVNGRYVPHGGANVHIEDRGYQFADGVYEVCEVRDGSLIDMPRHLTRLGRSLSELGIAKPMNDNALVHVLRETVRRNRVRDGLVYLQVTRGVAKRDHAFPKPGTRPALVVTARASDRRVAESKFEEGVSVVTVPDNRWERVDIKTVSLLPNVLAKQKAREAGAYEAWFVDADGYVTEGSSTNAWIVTKDGTVVSRPAETGILRGITRTTLLEAIEAEGLAFEERAFSVDEAKNAKEAFITAATTILVPVVKIDEASVGNGHPGETTTRLRERFREFVEAQAV